MKAYLISLGAGLLVGIVYALLNVRSPAPPVVALVGLFGILIGERGAALAKTWIARPIAEQTAAVDEPGLRAEPRR